ncbi:MBL fold metallo-hydrolase [Streptomyces sp. RLB3-17]|uniref:MBL fold metallo-hydrolase n=1 Tax=Streptomyces sp. RLB3-17 TaxID=2594455 RepID=UPI001CECF007|nr:MBL fold metallo-hydrolase [Streptomyces sp. RLB3-17]
MDTQRPRTEQTTEAAEKAAGARALDVRWIHGSPSAKHNTDPDIQVHAHDAHTVILRQNMAVDYEAPFLFLLFGETRAVLIDTGATASADWFPLRRVVDELLETWLTARPREGYELLVLHTHPHGDHVAGDAQFAGRPGTTVVDAALDKAWPFFGFDGDPEGVARVDLGGRVLECLATPGHHAAAVTYFDPWTGFLLTGDTVYPGRLYVEDWAAFTRTVDRLIDFCAERPVTHVLGCHIEMSGNRVWTIPSARPTSPTSRPCR